MARRVCSEGHKCIALTGFALRVKPSYGAPARLPRLGSHFESRYRERCSYVTGSDLHQDQARWIPRQSHDRVLVSAAHRSRCGPAPPSHGLLRDDVLHHHRRARWSDYRIHTARRQLVPTADRWRSRHYPHPVRILGPRGRPPPGLRVGARERHRRSHSRQPLRRNQLLLVDDQAQPPSREP